MPRFVVEWDSRHGNVLRVYPWDEWLQIPIHEREWECAVVEAKDEVDAFMRAQRGEI